MAPVTLPRCSEPSDPKETRMAKDSAIEEVRKVRREISAEFGHDTRALLDHYREVERRYGDRLLRKGPSPSSL